jgi:hypothetical protein
VTRFQHGRSPALGVTDGRLDTAAGPEFRGAAAAWAGATDS